MFGHAVPFRPSGSPSSHSFSPVEYPCVDISWWCRFAFHPPFYADPGLSGFSVHNKLGILHFPFFPPLPLPPLFSKRCLALTMCSRHDPEVFFSYFLSALERFQSSPFLRLFLLGMCVICVFRSSYFRFAKQFLSFPLNDNQSLFPLTLLSSKQDFFVSLFLAFRFFVFFSPQYVFNFPVSLMSDCPGSFSLQLLFLVAA